MPLPLPSKDKLKQIAKLIGTEGYSDEYIYKSAINITGSESIAQRALDWTPEAFGLLLASHIPDIAPPKTFHARDSRDVWHEFPLAAEPLVQELTKLAEEVISTGEVSLFAKLSQSSSIVATLNSALNAGIAAADIKLSGPAFVHLPADIYIGADAE